jgi:D-lactate dehydrogenase (cytochrome)
MTFWKCEQAALDFTKALRTNRAELGVEAIEYVGPNALTMLRDRRALLGSVSGVPACIPGSAACGIYLDLGTAAAAMPDTLSQLTELTRTHGGDPDRCWSATERDERERLRLFRHALPETVNATIAEVRRTHPTVTKLGTDMAVPDDRLDEVVELYRKTLDESGLKYVIFGHIGDNHLHVNILPASPDEYRQGWELYHDFAEKVVAMGGSPAAEHGIGKLKTDFLRILYGEAGLADMRRVKALFDPDHRLGQGTLFARNTDRP